MLEREIMRGIGWNWKNCSGYEFWLKKICIFVATGLGSHACGLKTSISRRLTLAGQFLTPDWKKWVVAVLLDTISKNMLPQTKSYYGSCSDPCKERKPCLKWINDNNFLAISDFVDKRFLDNFAFSRLRTSSEDFGLLRKTSELFGNLRKWSCRLQKSQYSQDKNLTLISQKKLQVYSLWLRL